MLPVELQVPSRAAVLARMRGAIAWAVALSLASFADEQALVLPRVFQNVLVKRNPGLLALARRALVELRHAALHARLARERRRVPPLHIIEKPWVEVQVPSLVSPHAQVPLRVFWGVAKESTRATDGLLLVKSSMPQHRFVKGTGIETLATDIALVLRMLAVALPALAAVPCKAPTAGNELPTLGTLGGTSSTPADADVRLAVVLCKC